MILRIPRWFPSSSSFPPASPRSFPRRRESTSLRGLNPLRPRNLALRRECHIQAESIANTIEVLRDAADFFPDVVLQDLTPL